MEEERHRLEAASVERAETRLREMQGRWAESRQRWQQAYDDHVATARLLMEAQAQLAAAIERERIARENLRTPLFEKEERVSLP